MVQKEDWASIQFGPIVKGREFEESSPSVYTTTMQNFLFNFHFPTACSLTTILPTNRARGSGDQFFQTMMHHPAMYVYVCDNQK